MEHVLRAPGERVTICAISGPGGVGKTFLLGHVLESIGIEQLGYMHLAADASALHARGDFFGLVEGQLFRRSLPGPADASTDYFPQLRKVAGIHRALVESASAELERDGAPTHVKRAAVALLKAGHILNKAIPMTREYLNVAGYNVTETQVVEALDDAWTLLGSLKTLRDAAFLWGPVRDHLSATLRQRVKRELHAVTASAVRGDLTAALGAGQPRSAGAIRSRIPRINRLLLVLDDHEVLGPVLDDFLIGSLIPELVASPFRTVLIVLGRDDLEVTNPGWSQYCKRYMREQIRLAPFDRTTAFALLAAAGVPEERREAMFEATQGYPFLLNLLLEETHTTVDSALLLRRCFDRVTRWMTPLERDWFVRVCYLDRIDEDTLGLVFDENEVSRVQEWFEREASVRDPATPWFQVRPLVREKVLRYQEVRAPRIHRILWEKTASARGSKCG